MHVLTEPLLLQRIADGIIEIRQELGLRLFGVRESLTPRVVDLIVVTTREPAPEFSLQAVVVGPAGAANVVSHKRIAVRRQEEARAERARRSLHARLRRVQERVA